MKAYQINQTKFLNESEVKELEEKIKYAYRPMDRLLIELALYTGARAQEILNIKKCDLHDGEESVFIIGLKGSNDREIPLRSPIYKRLKEFANQSTEAKGDKVFHIGYKTFRRIWLRYRPVKKKLHALRHTFAIRLYRKTKDIRLVQVALGHRSINNTMVYVQYQYATTELRKLIC